MDYWKKKKNSLSPNFIALPRGFTRGKKTLFQQDLNSVHNCEPVYWTFSIPLKINKSGNSIIMFTGMEDVYQSVLVSTDLFHKLYIRGWVKHQSFTVWGEIDGALLVLLGQEHIVSPFLNEKWTVGEIKLRGVEWGTVEPLTCFLHFTSAQLSPEPSSQWAQLPLLWGKQGQVEAGLQIGHNASETIINKAVNGRSPLNS